jgi:integrase
VQARLIGVHRVRVRLAGGAVAEYHYAFRGGPRIWRTGEPNPPGSPGYLAALGRAAPEPPSAGLFREIIRRYVDSGEYRKLSDRTRADYRKRLDLIDARFGSAPVDVFNRPEVRPLALEWRDQWTGKQAEYAWTVLRRVVSWAYDRGLLKHHHLRGGGKLYEADRSDILWPEAGVAKFRDLAPACVATALDAALETGLRPQDLVRLDRSQVLPTPRGRRIGVRTAKRGRMASIPVTPRMAEIIDAAPAEGPILRNASGRPWTRSYLSQQVKRYARKAELDERLHLHDARGTACTRLLMAGAGLRDLSLVFGWSPRHAAAMVEVYASLNPDAADAVLARLAECSVK